jgi:hypothetical protein
MKRPPLGGAGPRDHWSPQMAQRGSFGNTIKEETMRVRQQPHALAPMIGAIFTLAFSCSSPMGSAACSC